MVLADYLREQAAQFRGLAKLDPNPNIRRHLFALAVRCEELAMTIEDGPTFKRQVRARR